MRLRSNIGDLVGLGSVAALLLKLTATAVLAVSVVSKANGHQVIGPLDPILYSEVVCPNRIRAEVVQPLNFYHGTSRYFLGAPKNRVKLPSCDDGRLPANLPPVLRDEVRLVLGYLLATAIAMVLVLLAMRSLRHRGYPPAFEALCNRLEMDLKYRRAAPAPVAGPGDNGSSALAVAGGVATLLGIVTGGLGLMVAGPLLLAAAGKTDEARAQADTVGKSLEDLQQELLDSIREARGRFLREREMFLTSAFAVAVGVVAGNYAALGVKHGLALIDGKLPLPAEVGATVALALAAGLAALFPPKRLDSNGRYSFSLAAAWIGAVLAVALVSWLHDRGAGPGLFA